MIPKTKLSELSFFINLAEFSISSLKMGSFLTGGFSYSEVRIETPAIYFLLREGREASGEKFVGDGLPVLLANQGLSK